ncbi:hypothetical protein Syun_024639 [Stephania yunnanensis]|uniref:Uncharacterized protein n=1 Tax=Stephania yunnanensis TaxID=152371 RepID=A0AAP0I4S3_9MAGN
MEESSLGREIAETNEDEEDSSEAELLKFAGRIQTLISELLLLSSRIPPQFRDPRFDPVLFDLRYFDSPHNFEKRIEGNGELEELEDQLRESCSDFMKRFFLLANGIVLYYKELVRYVNDLHARNSLEGALQSEKGKQLLTESLALFGCLLLLLEHHMSGYLREKLLVAHIRSDHCFDNPNLEPLCLLCRVHRPTASSTVYQVQSSHLNSSMVTVQRPEEILLRFPFPEPVVESVISHLRNCDIYNHTPHYPDLEHRSVALAKQAGYVYVLLFYIPEYLHDAILMQEIVAMFFQDLWIVPIFMDFKVDLSFSWDMYKGAKASLSCCLLPAHVNHLCQLHSSKIKDLMSVLCSTLSEDSLTRDYVLNNSVELLSLISNCNFSLRWLLLHRTSLYKKGRDIVISAVAAHQIDEATLILFLLKTSQLEFVVKQLYMELLEEKDAIWLESRQHANDCMQDIFKYLGSWVISQRVREETLEDIFKNFSLEIGSLDHTNVDHARGKLLLVISTLTEIKQFHEIEEVLPMKQLVSATLQYLHDMLQALNLNKDALLAFSVLESQGSVNPLVAWLNYDMDARVSGVETAAFSKYCSVIFSIPITDATYSWGFVGDFIGKLFKIIEQDSTIVFNLRPLFLKFRSALEAPLLRLSQNQSPDLPFVSSYYSSQYRALIYAILEVIPATLFRMLTDDVAEALQSSQLQKAIQKDKLQDIMMPAEQFHLMKAFSQMSVFSRALTVFSGTHFGLSEMDIEGWIKEKMRKELYQRFEYMLKPLFLFPQTGLQQLEMNLKKTATHILSQMHLMEFFQDLMHIQGAHIWEEEFTSFLKNCLLKECDDFVSRRKEDLMFMGHLLHQVLKLTDPSKSMFIEPMSGWFDAEGCELLGLRFFDLLESCFHYPGELKECSEEFKIPGLFMGWVRAYARLDLSGPISECLAFFRFDVRCQPLGTRALMQLQMLDEALGPATSLPLLDWSSYKHMLKAGLVSSAFDGMVASAISEREKMLQHPQEKRNENFEALFIELSKQGMLCGSFSSLQTPYISEEPPSFLSRCMCAVSISQLMYHLVACLWKQLFTWVLTATFWLKYFCKHMLPEDIEHSCLPSFLFTLLQCCSSFTAVVAAFL